MKLFRTSHSLMVFFQKGVGRSFSNIFGKEKSLVEAKCLQVVTVFKTQSCSIRAEPPESARAPANEQCYLHVHPGTNPVCSQGRAKRRRSEGMKRGIKSRFSNQQLSLANGNAGVFYFPLCVVSDHAIWVFVVLFCFFFEREGG